MVFKICEGIPCSSFSVKELDVIVHKKNFLVQLCLILAILHPTSLANLVVEVGTRHSHQTLLVDNISSQIHHLVNTGLTVGSLVKWLPILVANPSKIDKFEWFIARRLEMAPSDCNHL